ncbi:MAG: type 1 glutamine amidotransferase domain-containing protein [Acidobacteriaceae bacterium]
MAGVLKGKTIAILATDGVEQSELVEPRKALERAGAETEVVAPHSGEIKGWDLADWGRQIKVVRELNEASYVDYDALFIPGGVMNHDKLRVDTRAVAFVKKFFDAGKPVAAICHGPWMLVEAGVLQGRKLTSWPSLQTDIRNAGGIWVDEEVMIDGNLTTSRKPDDLAAFSKAIVEQFAAADTLPKTA